jgi:peptide/nickel transport system substrate-binding protein
MNNRSQRPHSSPTLLNRWFSFTESLPPSDSFAFKLVSFVAVVSFITALVFVSSGGRTEVATRGGALTEGIVGTPRFVNPVLAVTRADRDMSALIFDGLMTLGPDGVLVPNLAESVTVSEDGLTYNIVLRRDVSFHDGMPLTALDVLFTIGKIQEPMIISPLRASFDGISVEQVGDYELNIVLQEPYTPFIENLTFGILPEHIWRGVSAEEFPFSQKNSEPVGTGPYQIRQIARSTSGIPESYELAPHMTYHRGTPRIERFTIRFYPNGDALRTAIAAGNVDSVSGIDGTHIEGLGIDETTHTIVHMPLPRIFALRDAGARKALDAAIDRTELVNSVLGGYALPAYAPLPRGFGIEVPTPEIPDGDAAERARAILKDAGWKLNIETGVWEKEIDGSTTILSLSIATVNNPVFEATAQFLRAAWERLGVIVEIKQFEQSDLTQSIIRPRDYEALLFGTQVGRSLDVYSFWHSSQRNDPGLNVALYANITTDSILSTARTATSSEGRNESLLKFSDEVTKESPAVFLYQPELIYILPRNVAGASFQGVGEAQERFTNIHDWYIETESLWNFLYTP